MADSIRHTPLSAPPRFCTVDGSVLLDQQIEMTEGFDPFTGQELPRRMHVVRRCQTEAHDVWVRYDTGWVRV